MASHLSMEERKRISELREQGFSRGQMARALGRAKSTLSRELERNRLGCLYDPVLAQQKSEARRRERPLVKKMDQPAIAERVRDGLEAYHSPDEIAGRMKLTIADPRQRISAPTIYRWIRRQPPGTWDRYLRRYRKHRRGLKRGGISGAVEIAGRPAEANERRACGHWEGDLLHGAWRHGDVVVLVDRKSRFLLVAKTKDRKAWRVRSKLQKLLGALPPEQRLSVTFDHGSEFAQHELLTARLNLPVFFARPYCPWQRGTCENTNGLIRQFFPKGTYFDEMNPQRLADAAGLLNHRPRKILGYFTPSEVFKNCAPVAIEG
jgi:transposase, IS30 family